MGSQSVIAYVFSKYPSVDQKDFQEKCTDSIDTIKTWRDFAIALAAHNADEGICVQMSSTWAVCQEYLGTLKGADLCYAQGRGGNWSTVWNQQTAECDQVSVRQVLSDIKNKFP